MLKYRVDTEELGRRLKARRLEMGLSQETLSNEVVACHRSIRKMEKGESTRVSLDRIVELSQVLEVHPSYFLDGIFIEIEDARTLETVADLQALYDEYTM